MMQSRTKVLSLTAALCALAAVLSYAESLVSSLILFPLPGLRLGLSNVAVMAAFLLLGPLPALIVVVTKCLLVFLLVGSPLSFILSLSGSALAFFSILITRCGQCRFCSMVGASVLSSALHVTGQVLCAALLCGGSLIPVYLPPLLLASIPTGAVTGWLLSVTVRGARKRKVES